MLRLLSLALIGSGLAFFLMKSSKADKLTWRQDFSLSLQQEFCKPQRTDVKPLKLWQANIFDAQIIGKTLTANSGGSLEKQAKDYALAHKYLGYAYGQCPDQRRWIAAVPAPTPFMTYKHTHKILKKHCGKWRLNYARQGLHRAQTLQTFPETSLNPGVLSISCVRKKHENLGFQLWYLMPTSPGTDLTPPYSERVNTFSDIPAWLNLVRKNLNLPSLNFRHSALHAAISELSKVDKIRHDLMKLKQAKNQLAKQNIKLIGENKVIAPQAKDALWLLWNSPSHRLSLTHQHANLAQMHTVRVKNSTQKRLLLLLAKTR